MLQFLKTQVQLDSQHQNVIFKLFFYPLSIVFSWLSCFRNLLYDFKILKSRRLPAKITVSVGNLTVGGTGKTPFVIWLIKYILQEKPDVRIFVLSRGYGSRLGAGDYAVYRGGQITELFTRYFFDPLCDEARLISSNCPSVTVVAGKRRTWALTTFLAQSKESNPDIVILDDGLQHRKIFRDINIVVFPAVNPYGNGKLIPAGTLRENPMYAKRRIDAAVSISTATLKPIHLENESVGDTFKARFFLARRYLNLEDAKSWKQQFGQVTALLGIARPEEVLKNWKEVGLNVSADNAILLGDHEIFTESVRQQVVALNLPVLTTEKDFQRNRGFFEDLGLPYFVLKQELYEQEDKLKVWVSEHISSCVDRKPG